DLVGLAEPLRDAAEVLVDEAEPDALGDVLSGGGPRDDVRPGKKGEEARVRSPAPVAVQEDSALALPAQVALATQRVQYSPDGAVVGDQRRALPGEDVEGDVDADEIEH